jgi:hypothetical protein
MDLDALAFYGAVKAAGLIEESPTCVLLHIGHRSTGMVFVVDGAVRALRSVRLGVDSVAHGMARDMEIDASEAAGKVEEIAGEEQGDLLVPLHADEGKAETRKGHAEMERDLFHQKRDDFAARLKREYIRSVAALRGGAAPARVLATGPGVAMPGLLELLSHRFGVAVEAFRPSEAFTCKLNGAAEPFDHNGAVALGLALKGAGHDPLDLDFRQEELRVANKFELLKNSLAVTVTLLFFGLLAFSAYCVLKMRTLDNERFASVLDNAYKPFQDVATNYNGLGSIIEARHHVKPEKVEAAGPRYEAVKRYLRELERMKRNLHTIVGDTKGLPQITSALQIWNDVFGLVARLHEKLRFIDFTTINVSQTMVTLVMIVPDAEATQELEQGLKTLPSLSQMVLEDGWNLSPVTGTDLQTVTFTFKKDEK